MKSFKGYANYGCLAAEKRIIYTGENPAGTAKVSEEMEFTVPEGWEVDEDAVGRIILTSPWGWTYFPNEVLAGNEKPCFLVMDKDAKEHRIAIKSRKLE